MRDSLKQLLTHTYLQDPGITMVATKSAAVFLCCTGAYENHRKGTSIHKIYLVVPL